MIALLGSGWAYFDSDHGVLSDDVAAWCCSWLRLGLLSDVAIALYWKTIKQSSPLCNVWLPIRTKRFLAESHDNVHNSIRENTRFSRGSRFRSVLRSEHVPSSHHNITKYAKSVPVLFVIGEQLDLDDRSCYPSHLFAVPANCYSPLEWNKKRLSNLWTSWRVAYYWKNCSRSPQV